MIYTKIKANNTAKQIYSQRKKQTEYNNAIYSAQIPIHIERKKYDSCKPEISGEVSAELKRIVDVKNTEYPDKISKHDFGAINGLCMVMSILLVFTGVYISGIRAPEYIEKGILNLVEWARMTYESDNDVSAKGSGDYRMGEKVFVEKLQTSTEIIKNKAEEKTEDDKENANFARSVKLAAEDKSKELPSDIPTMTEKKNAKDENDGDSVAVISKNMSAGSDKIYFTNRTKLEIDGQELLEKKYPIEKASPGNSDGPLVLIVHTHGTESYIDSGDKGQTRTDDISRNIVRVGEELKNVLESYGIPTIHSKTMHDKISYINSYSNSRKEVEEYLKNNPSIRYVIDVHRDALGPQGNTPVKTYIEINGEEAAQLMLVMGTNAGGGDHSDYEKNLTVAAYLQKNANDLYPGLMRAINIRPNVFNQNLADGYILLEVGSDANKMSEALCAVRMFGRCFVQTIS